MAKLGDDIYSSKMTKQQQQQKNKKKKKKKQTKKQKKIQLFETDQLVVATNYPLISVNSDQI